MQRFGVTFPTLLDLASEEYPASNAYGITSVPSLFLMERDGIVTRSFNGFSKRDFEEIGQRGGVSPFGPDDQCAGMESRLRLQELGPVWDLR